MLDEQSHDEAEQEEDEDDEACHQSSADHEISPVTVWRRVLIHWRRCQFSLRALWLHFTWWGLLNILRQASSGGRNISLESALREEGERTIYV